MTNLKKISYEVVNLAYLHIVPTNTFHISARHAWDTIICKDNFALALGIHHGIKIHSQTVSTSLNHVKSGQ